MAFAMTGWRLGYLHLPEALLRPAQKIQQNFFISAADFAQTAAITALREGWPDVERMCREYDTRRRRIVAGLRELGFSIATEPTGAFYVLADARHLDPDSKRLAFDILNRAKVGVSPGIDFGTSAEGYIRFCYAASIDRIDEALRRLRVYLDER
jgi:aspartate/methionine/tyrosine aminotransferase